MDRNGLLTFMRRERYAVQASVSGSGEPQAALVGIVVTDGFEIFFDTLAMSRKAKNIRTVPMVALVVGPADSASEQRAQCIYRAKQICALCNTSRTRGGAVYFHEDPRRSAVDSNRKLSMKASRMNRQAPNLRCSSISISLVSRTAVRDGIGETSHTFESSRGGSDTATILLILRRSLNLGPTNCWTEV